MDFVVGNEQLDHYHRGAYLKKSWSCCKQEDKYAEGCCGITESNESRTRRLSREVTFNTALQEPGRSNSGSSGTSRHSSDDSWQVVHRNSSYLGIFSDDEYTDEEGA
jgi:hypothetical protein